MDGKVRVIVAASIISVSTVWGMEKDAKTSSDKKLTIYAVPGLGNAGSEEAYVQNNVFPGYQYRHKSILIPRAKCDLGQGKSSGYVAEEIEQDMAVHPEETDENTIRGMHLSSQGGVAGLKALELLRKVGRPVIDFAVAEGVFGCDKNAIERSLHGKRAGNYSVLRSIPFPKLWAPYVVRLLEFPDYWPANKQLIESVADIPKDPVTILVYGTDDQRVPHDDGYALYYAMRLSGHDKAYIISQQGADHIRLLQPADASKIQAILRHHNLLPAKKDGAANMESVDITQYQPDINSNGFRKYIEIYNCMRETQRTHEGIEAAWEATKVVTGVAVTYAALRKLLEKYQVTTLHDMEKAIWNAMPHESFYAITVLSFVSEEFV